MTPRHWSISRVHALFFGFLCLYFSFSSSNKLWWGFFLPQNVIIPWSVWAAAGSGEEGAAVVQRLHSRTICHSLTSATGPPSHGGTMHHIYCARDSNENTDSVIHAFITPLGCVFVFFLHALSKRSQSRQPCKSPSSCTLWKHAN